LFNHWCSSCAKKKRKDLKTQEQETQRIQYEQDQNELLRNARKELEKQQLENNLSFLIRSHANLMASNYLKYTKKKVNMEDIVTLYEVILTPRYLLVNRMYILIRE